MYRTQRADLSFDWWPRNGRLIRDCARVHCGSFAAAVAWALGRNVPDQHHRRNFAVIPVQLRDRAGHFGVNEWRWQLGMAAAPAALFLVMLLGIPPSPRWLAVQG